MEPFSLVSTLARLAPLHLNLTLKVQKSAPFVQLEKHVGGGLDSILLNPFPVLKVTTVQLEPQPLISSLALLEHTPIFPT